MADVILRHLQHCSQSWRVRSWKGENAIGTEGQNHAHQEVEALGSAVKSSLTSDLFRKLACHLHDLAPRGVQLQHLPPAALLDVPEHARVVCMAGTIRSCACVPQSHAWCPARYGFGS